MTAIVFGATALLLAAGVHAPFVRTRALAFLIARVADAGFVARAETLDYNVFTRTVRLSGLTVAVPSAIDSPFLAAREVAVTLPWSAIRGGFSLERVDIVSPRVTLRRDASGRDNWTPGPHDTSTPGPLTLHIGHATATDAVFDWTDARSSSHVDAALALDLSATGSAIAGPIVMAGPARVRWRDRSTAIEIARGIVSWNDRDLAIEGAWLRAAEGTLRLDGKIDEVLGAARIEARIEADANLAAISPWLDLQRAIAGTAHAAAHVDGTGVDITNLRAEVAGGEAKMRGRVAFDGTGSMRAAWTRLDLSEILRQTMTNPLAVQPSSRIDGDLDARWTGSRLDDIQLEARGRLIGQPAPVRRRALPVDATFALAVRRSHWKLAATSVDALGIHAVASLNGTLDVDDLLQSSIAGTLGARTIDDRDWVRALARAGLVDAEPAIAGPISTEFIVGGTFGAPSLDGRVDATLRHPSLPASTIRGRASLSKDALALNDIDARMAGSAVRGAVRWTPASDDISGTLTGSLPLKDLALLVPSLPASLTLDGSVEVSAALAGSPARPRVALSGAGDGLDVAGQPIDRLATDARLDGRRLTIDRVLLESEGGRLEGTGTLDLERETYTANASATNLLVHPILDVGGERGRPFSGRLNGTFEGTGSLQQPGGRGHLSMTAARWRDADFGALNSDVTLAGRAAAFTFDASDVALEGQGSVGLDTAGAMSLSATWRPEDVAAVARRLSVDVPISGSAALGLEWTGTRDRPENGRAQVSVNQADISIANQHLRLVQPGRVDADGTVVRVTPIVLATGVSRLTIDGVLGDASASRPLAITLDGSLADFGFVRDLLQPESEDSAAPPLAGSVRGGLTADGTTAAPRISGAFEIRDGLVPLNDRARVTGIEIGARYSDGVLVVDRAAGAFEGASLAATARVPSAVFIDRLPEAMRRWIPAVSGPATLSAQVRSITPSVAAPFVDAATLEQIAMHSDAAIDLAADRPALDRLRGTVVLSRAELSLAGVAFDQQTPTRLAVGGGRVTVESWNWGRDENRIALRGGMALGADPSLDLTADAALDLRLLNAFTPAARTAGRVDAEIHLGGTARAPAIDGYLTVSNGETRVANPRLVVDDVNGTVVLDGDTIAVRGVSATVNGGGADISGSFRHHWLVPSGGSLTFTAKGSAIDIADLRAEADAALTWTLDANSSTIGGHVTLVRSAYREQVTLARNVLAALRRSSAPVPVADVANASLLERTRLDVRLVTGDDLLVDNNVARLTVHGDLRAVGPASNPSVTGRLELGEGGVVFFNGTRYRLSDRRSIDFANPTRIEPDLDISAVARVQGEDITVSLRGTPATLESTLESSNKNLSQSDLVSLLLVGRTATSSEMASSDELVGLLTGNFLEAAGRAIGFDTARVERGTPDVRFDAGLVAIETDPGTRLTFGKTIGPHVELVFSQSLQQSGGLTWIVGYKPRAGIDLRLVTLDDGDRLYTFSHDITLGGGTRAAVTKAAPAARVSDVAITGAGADEAALRSRLKLAPDDRFSFFEWQDDRERLERFFHERQHLEARIAARRSTEPGDANQVRLVYDVRPGPRTIIGVDGFSLPAAAIAAIERAWSRSVVDDFLIEEVTAIARGELADAGYLLPAIAVRVDGTADGRELRIAITPGEHVRQRHVEFSGNANESSSRLLIALAERGVTRAVWTDPDEVGRALTSFYRSNGFLNAAVRVGDVTVSNGTAIRPIHVDEGVAFQVGAVRIEGVHAFTPEEAARFAGISQGERYTAARLEGGQAALDAQYRARGFNRVGIDYQARVPEPGGEVEIVVRVDEGPQQRLREIATKGLAHTRPALLSRALQLKVGEPVDLAAWNAARRRAYETGAFRSVDIERDVLAPAGPATGDSAVAEEPVRATVTVQEWPPLRVRYGVEVRDELAAAGDAARTSTFDDGSGSGRTFGLGLAGDLGARGLFGRAISAGVAGRYAPGSRVVRTYLTSPLFFGRAIASTVFLERSREESGADAASGLAAFETLKTDVTLEQRIRLARRTTLSYGYTRERNHTRRLDPDPLDPNPFDLIETIGYFTSAGILDTRDDPTDATQGWFHSSTVQYAPALGSTQRFIRYFVQQQYFRHADRVVFATAARLGLARGLGLPLVPSKRFFAGGGNSVRGYAEDVVGPIDFLGAAAGGNALLVINQEVRFPIVKPVRGVGFFDAGRAFDEIGSLSLGALATSAGLGLRVQTPFVLIRVDLAMPFDRAFGPRRPRWFISIGQMF